MEGILLQSFFHSLLMAILQYPVCSFERSWRNKILYRLTSVVKNVFLRTHRRQKNPNEIFIINELQGIKCIYYPLIFLRFFLRELKEHVMNFTDRKHLLIIKTDKNMWNKYEIHFVIIY